jgi:hypothetical protein
MHRQILSLVAVFAATALASVASANSVTPRPGYYDSSGYANEDVTFFLTEHGTITHLRIGGFHVPGTFHLNEHHKFHWGKTAAEHGGGTFSGHGVWFENGRCHGDLRHYKGGDETNSYHVWSARRVRARISDPNS